MEQIFLVKNGDLGEVNRKLQEGGRVKAIHAVSQVVSDYGYVGEDTSIFHDGSHKGDIYAYVVIEFERIVVRKINVRNNNYDQRD